MTFLHICLRGFCHRNYVCVYTARVQSVGVCAEKLKGGSSSISTMTLVKMAINHLLVSELRKLSECKVEKRNLMILFLFSIQKWFTSLRSHDWWVWLSPEKAWGNRENSSPFIDLTLLLWRCPWNHYTGCWTFYLPFLFYY